MANTVMSIPYFLSSFALPLFGLFVDRYGLIAIWISFASAVLMVVHLLLAYTRVDPIYLMVGQGLAYTIYAAAIWPAIPLVVEKQHLGIAFGVAFSVQSIGLTLVPLAMAAVYQSSGDKYIPNVEVLMGSIAILAFIMSLWLNYYDFTHDYIFNSVNSRARLRSVTVSEDVIQTSSLFRNLSPDEEKARTLSHEKKW
jgi:hypothetical protein